jgi:hypothetical protein
MCGADTRTPQEADQKYLEHFEMWCWGRMEKISWTDRVRNEILHRIKEGSNILRTIKRRRANWIGRISSVYLSLRVKQLGSCWTDFREI